MQLTEEQHDILYSAWLVARRGNYGLVLENTAVPAAHHLCELGWLRRESTRDGELPWSWSEQGTTALDVNALLHGADGRQN